MDIQVNSRDQEPSLVSRTNSIPHSDLPLAPVPLPLGGQPPSTCQPYPSPIREMSGARTEQMHPHLQVLPARGCGSGGRRGQLKQRDRVTTAALPLEVSVWPLIACRCGATSSRSRGNCVDPDWPAAFVHLEFRRYGQIAVKGCRQNTCFSFQSFASHIPLKYLFFKKNM